MTVRSQTGKTIWITGLSGAGKTSVARALYGRFKKSQANIVFLDGDHFRQIMGDELGHDLKDRVRNAFRIARMCHFLNSENIDVVCATMSLYPEVWEWCRENIAQYIQVYLKVDKEVLVTRDAKMIYSDFLNGRRANVVGMDLPFHEPAQPDLVIDNNTANVSFDEEAAEKIIDYLKGKKLL